MRWIDYFPIDCGTIPCAFDGMSTEGAKLDLCSDTYTLLLVPSEKCNLHCRYCYETQKNPKSMDRAFAFKVIDDAFSKVGEDTMLRIEFRGGEPFLEFDFVRDICEWVMAKYKGRRFCFCAVTNGTCFSSEIKEWLTKYAGIFEAPLSIDGDAAVHNHNRSNSFSMIDIDFVVNTWHRPRTYTTIIPENAASMFAAMRFLLSKGFAVRCNFEFATLWTQPQLQELSRRLKQLADYMVCHDTNNTLNLFSRQGILNYTGKDEENREHILICNAGRSRKFVTPDGDVYPCHTFAHSAFNHHSAQGHEDYFDMLKSEVLNPPICCECNFFYLCYICVGFSYNYKGDFKWRNKSFCELTRIRTFADMYYWYNRLNKKNGLNKDDKELLSKIKRVYVRESNER